MGSDTCGSIRIPASHQSLFGLRGTAGLSSRAGIVPLSSTQDEGGPLARQWHALGERDASGWHGMAAAGCIAAGSVAEAVKDAAGDFREGAERAGEGAKEEAAETTNAARQ